MLIHGDGNSNIVQGSCFEIDNYIDKGVNVVLMNPPYNAQRKQCKKEYVDTWSQNTKMDPSKGFHFVYEIAERVKTGKLIVYYYLCNVLLVVQKKKILYIIKMKC